MIYKPLFFGVCEWIAQKLDIGAPIIRVAFIVFMLVGGASILLYFILLLIKLILNE